MFERLRRVNHHEPGHDFDRRLVHAIQGWAERHPNPDAPLLGTAEGRTLSARQLAHEMTEKTAIGRKQIEIYRHFAHVDELGGDGVIEMFEEVGTGPDSGGGNASGADPESALPYG